MMKTYTIRAVTKAGVKLPEFECSQRWPSHALFEYENWLWNKHDTIVADIQCIDIDIKETEQ